MQQVFRNKVGAAFAIALLNLLMSGCSQADDQSWRDKAMSLRWVDYSPSTGNPDQGIEAGVDAIRLDLLELRRAHFSGLVTYSSNGRLGKELIPLAKDAGFRGIIIGVWNPKDEAELSAAKQAASSEIVMGICIGNEGLMNHQYSIEELESAIKGMRAATNKPVTTTEIIQNCDERLLGVGDWVFPNAHPYHAKVTEPKAAVLWTKEKFRQIKGQTSKFVMLKEVGLPTAGDAERPLSEQAQCEYYDGLAQTNASFVYFEAFDQSWKLHKPVEPHWGIFLSDRSPKIVARHLAENTACGAKTSSKEPITPVEKTASEIFYVYHDSDSRVNHFSPKGRMGDVGDITLQEDWDSKPKAGKTCIRVEYSARGEKPSCEYAGSGPCGWAGVYWQNPPLNWGKKEEWNGEAYDLSHYQKLKFWARAEHPSVVEFKVGGIVGPFGDSLRPARGITAHLTEEWTEFTIDLTEADLKHIIGGFAWVASKERNGRGAVFYLDEIRFESQ